MYSYQQRIGTVLDLFTNYDKKSKCVDYKKGGYYGNLDGDGWEYQVSNLLTCLINVR